MLPLGKFLYFSPRTLDGLFKQLLDSEVKSPKFMAGGTDLIPNLKHKLYDVDAIFSLSKMSGLRQVEINENKLDIGALVTLSTLGEHALIKQKVPTLGKASLQIASPQIRNMATIGGNICLDTRCLYFNQTEFWRRALGYCLKKDGDCCHVVQGGRRCVAAASNDLATVLLALDATVTISSPQKTANIKLTSFYTGNGIKNNILTTNQIVTTITVPISPSLKTGFHKLRFRQGIDFPLLSAAIATELDNHERIRSLRIVLNAVVAKPKVLDLAKFKGVSYNREVLEGVLDMAEESCHPQTNIGGNKAWRKKMVRHAVKEAFLDAGVTRIGDAL